MSNGLLTLAIHWPRFGPYHIARIRAANNLMLPFGIRVVALETASKDETYQWREEKQNINIEQYVAFPERFAEKITFLQAWQQFQTILRLVKPAVIAINGYKSNDSLALLGWCKKNNIHAILMSESKEDDYTRDKWKELLKKILIQSFSSCICGGSLHRAYLEKLGMKSSRIFLGYDVVDNDFFSCGADYARRNTQEFYHLPGLNSSTPFFLASSRFILRKNLHGLILAYSDYRLYCRKLKLNPWNLVILGDGEERNNLESIIHDGSIEGITLAGFQKIDDLPAYYGLASVFVHPALNDQWGLVVNEAMAAGLPVLVSSRCGCAPDLIIESENGLTFNPKERNALIDLLISVSSGEFDLQRMGIASRKIINDWGPERFAQGILDAIKLALE